MKDGERVVVDDPSSMGFGSSADTPAEGQAFTVFSDNVVNSFFGDIAGITLLDQPRSTETNGSA